MWRFHVTFSHLAQAFIQSNLEKRYNANKKNLSQVKNIKAKYYTKKCFISLHKNTRWDRDLSTYEFAEEFCFQQT